MPLRMDDPRYPDWPDGLLTEQEAALSRGWSANTLRNRRLKGKPAAHVIVDGHALYWAEDVALIEPLPTGRSRKDASPYVMSSPSRPAPAAELLKRSRKPRAASGRTDGTPRHAKLGKQDLAFLAAAQDERGLISERAASIGLGLPPDGIAKRRRYGSPVPAVAGQRGRQRFYTLLELLHFDPSASWGAKLRAEAPQPTYRTAHRYLQGRGAASLHGCSAPNCDAQADNWAWIGLGRCNAILTEGHGREKGRKYCLHPVSHYIPLCRVHHAAFDNGQLPELEQAIAKARGESVD